MVILAVIITLEVVVTVVKAAAAPTIVLVESPRSNSSISYPHRSSRSGSSGSNTSSIMKTAVTGL